MDNNIETVVINIDYPTRESKANIIYRTNVGKNTLKPLEMKLLLEIHIGLQSLWKGK